MRLQKFLSEAGVASRRGAEGLIHEGRVRVNEVTIEEQGVKVDPEEDRIRLDDRPIRLKEKIYLALNKPRGYVCSRARQQRERILHDLLPAEWRHLYSIGRLDRDSEGLIFLTNDGDLCLKISHPKYEVKKRYHIEIGRTVDDSVVQRLQEGVWDHGEWLKAERAWAVPPTGLKIELVEGRNREIRRMLAALGERVQQLRRDRIGSVRLGKLKSGEWRHLNRNEVRSFLNERAGDE